MRILEERSERLELVATILLGLATVASAWCTYQAQLWDSEQLEKLGAAGALQSQSARALDVANRDALLDAATFANVLQAEGRGDNRTAAFLAANARVPFRPLLHRWMATQRAPGGQPQGTPFEDPAYRDDLQKETVALQQKAEAAMRAGHIANSNSDLFVMRTVMLAMSLFFLGIAGQLNGRQARHLAVIFGAVILAGTLLSLLALHPAPRPSRVLPPTAGDSAPPAPATDGNGPGK
jgi:hypothetical protein